MCLKNMQSESHFRASPSIKTNYYIRKCNCKPFDSITKLITLASGNRYPSQVLSSVWQALNGTTNPWGWMWGCPVFHREASPVQITKS